MLSVIDLHKTYGDVVALDGCSFDVSRGEMLGFLGPNGAGKTTAMRTIFGLVTPNSGQVTWDGQPIEMRDRLNFGYMPEQRGLYPKMKAHDQLTYLGRLHGMPSSDAATAADRWLERFGLAERRSDPVEALSHGNQQRVQLAAALVHDPELLVLDEPFSGLDPIAVETMSDVLREQADAGKAVVFSSHQLDLVEDLCEHVAIINQGHIVLDGDVRRLKAASDRRVLEVEAADGADGLLDGLAGVLSSSFDGNRHRVMLRADVDVRHVLAAADRQETVHHLSYSTPSLSELFTEAVA